ncbi:uncharacterized protein EI90DRAFT_281132 [Cantharellus anzutake]|uniref:uncharacterized protein n=1 Tax=Cantharellus anzutake TaxID=1750568 RepID=UPI001903C5DA|nr:uncharacterized protein EI90DRAFT_281132 [Cantharellus anzutake]KAF8335949.1 hypothetical protein EI90DRAFT_281132 [Cantharellus anzutake]
MTLFEGLPDELLLRIFKDHELQPHELQVISSLSKRIRRAALDDSIWRRICHVIMSGCSLLGDEEEVQLTKWGAQSFYDLWVSLLRQWSPFIGFWVASPSRDIIYIAPCNTRGAILVANLDLTNAFKPDPKDNLRFRVRSIARSEYRYPLYIQTADMLIHATEEDIAGSVFLNGVISVGLYIPHYKVLRTDFYGLLQQGDGSAVVPFSPTTFQRSVVRSDWIGGLGRPPRQRVCPGLMPSPAMAPIIRSLVHTGNEVEFPCLQCWNYSRHSKYIPLGPPKRTDIHASPSALNILDYPSNLIDSGLFAGPYKDSLELFYITVRTHRKGFS